MTSKETVGEEQVNCAHNRLAAVLLVVLGLATVTSCSGANGTDRADRSLRGETATPVTPEGTILFTRIRTDGKPALFTVAADGTRVRLFVTKASSAAVSLDGQRILFVRGRAIWQMRRNGSGQRQLTRPPTSSSDSDPAWSPNGQGLYFTREVEVGCFAPFSMRVDGAAVRRLTRGCPDTGGDDELAPSPDGRVIAYTSWGHGGGDDWSFLEAMTPAGRKAKLGFRSTEASHEWSPAWASDGERLAFAALDADSWDRDQVGLSGIYVAARTGAAQRVFRPVNRWPYVRQPAWSPDGRWIAFTWDRSEPDSDIWIVPAEGGVARRVTTGKAVDSGPAWLMPERS